MDYDIIIVGGGIMGIMTASHIGKKKILLIEKDTLESDTNASFDKSRIFRHGYGDDIFYTMLAKESLAMWKELEKKWKVQFLHQTGLLYLGDHPQGFAMKTYEGLRKSGVAVELLVDKEVAKRFPQCEGKFGVFEPSAGILDPQLIIKKMRKALGNITVLEKEEVIEVQPKKVTLRSGKKFTTETIVVCAGPWTRRLLPKVPIGACKQALLYMKPKLSAEFQMGKFPVFAQLERGFYGFPCFNSEGIKIGNHLPGELSEPEDREFLEDFEEPCREFFREFIPALADAEIIEKKICYYDMTDDSDFIIDQYESGIIVGTGFSGHGYKFAPVIGRLLAELALTGKTERPYPRFRLSRFEHRSC